MEMDRISLKDRREKDAGLSSAQVLIFSFLVIIFIGTILLSMPFTTVDGEGLDLIDAIFTATSAVCVTGLIVVDTGTHFTHAGQMIIMFLIQIGGLGFMTLATSAFILLGKKISLKERVHLQEMLNQDSLSGVVGLIKSIIIYTFIIESMGAILLTGFFYRTMDFDEAVFKGIFHSISAFNNAGFDILGDFKSLSDYSGDIYLNLVIMSLIILGGLGFIVLRDLYNNRLKLKKLTLHTKIVLTVSGGLILLGAVGIFALEYTNINIFGEKGFLNHIVVSIFQSVTTRTAGFGTVDFSLLRTETLFFMIVLMFIGASPGSTGGGIKTTTFLVYVLAIFNMIRNKETTVIKERTIERDLIRKAIAITSLASILVIIIIILLLVTESFGFIQIAFEAVSAFCTVGLSTGITQSLSIWGKVIICVTMFIGRIGPLTAFLALTSSDKKKENIMYPDGKVMIG